MNQRNGHTDCPGRKAISAVKQLRQIKYRSQTAAIFPSHYPHLLLSLSHRPEGGALS
jgi:hypothetical protein